MLKLSLAAGEYLTINGNIVVQVYRAENGRSYLAIDAPGRQFYIIPKLGREVL